MTNQIKVFYLKGVTPSKYLKKIFFMKKKLNRLSNPEFYAEQEFENRIKKSSLDPEIFHFI